MKFRAILGSQECSAGNTRVCNYARMLANRCRPAFLIFFDWHQLSLSRPRPLAPAIGCATLLVTVGAVARAAEAFAPSSLQRPAAVFAGANGLGAIKSVDQQRPE